VKSRPDLREELAQNGFHYSHSDGDFYFPLTIDPEELAKGFDDGEPEQAFEPGLLAIAAMIKSAPLFEQLAAGVASDRPVKTATPKKRAAPKALVDANTASVRQRRSRRQ
jgi:hypothetical protein